MNSTITSKEKNIVKFTFEADAKQFEEGLDYAYKKNKSKISIPGFRKGKAPRKIIESHYGENVFYDDAINYVLNEEYDKVIEELELDVVSKPEVDVESVDKEKGIKFVVEVVTKPEVTLGQYKGVEVEKVAVEVNDDEIENELKKTQEQNSRIISVTDRAAQMNDVVTINYVGSVDGEEFEGGKANDYELTLGSKTFIDTFEDQIVGHNIGDAFDVNVKFPEQYHAKELAGKDAVFAVELKSISYKELPELNDEFAQDVSEFDTLEEYKNSIKEKIQKQKDEDAKRVQGDAMLDKATDNCTMDVPEVMYENKIDQLMAQFEENMSRQGLTIDMYCQFMNTSIEALRQNFRGTAEKSVRARLMLEAVAKAENITVTKEELDNEIEEIGKGYGLKEGQMLELISEKDRKNLEEDMIIHKAVDIIENSAVIK